MKTLPELDCPPGYTAQVHYDGGGSTIIQLDDPAVAVDVSLGLLIGLGAGADADWAGYQVTRNSVCASGCFVGCQPGQMACIGDPTSVGCLLCSNDIDQQACAEFVSTCEPPDPGGDGGLDETGGDGDGGDDETTGGVMDAPYDCTQWHPEAIRRPVAGGPFHLPQALLDELVQSNADALAECDGVRLRQASSGRWMISKMRSGSGGGLLGALGLRVGDELAALDGVRLDSTDALLGMLGRFIDEDGGPRQLSPGHPGFALRVRRGEQELEVGLRVGVERNR